MSKRPGAPPQRDLIVLTACKDSEYALRGLLARPERIGIRQVEADFRVHPQKDNGCRSNPEGILRSQARLYRYALIVFDRDGSGEEKAGTASEVAERVEERLGKNGWEKGRVRAVVIEPELEAWVWSDSPQVEQILGWAGQDPGLRRWLESEGFLVPGQLKPHPPKDAVLGALAKVNKPRSARIYQELAETVSFRRCEDAAFARLLEILRVWFAP